MYDVVLIKELKIQDLFKIRDALSILIKYGMGDEELAYIVDGELNRRENEEK